MPRIQYKSYKGITLLARNLRKNLTPSERLLWEILRRKNFSGYKFLRQHPIFYRVDKGWVDFYIPDFYCSELKLIIEVDGPIHDRHKEYDIERDAKLQKKGIRVVRFKNIELEDFDSVTSLIKEILIHRISQIADSEQE